MTGTTSTSPRELQLLFLHTGFRVDAVWGDYTFRAPRSWTREIVMMGETPGVAHGL